MNPWLLASVTWLALSVVLALIAGHLLEERTPRKVWGSAGEPASRSLRVLVGGREPLERELVRFFLEEGGCQVVGKVSQAVDAVSQVVESRADAVVLFESVAADQGAGLIQRIRRASPSTKIVIVTPAPEEAWRGSARGADAFLEKWVGLQELEFVLSRLCPSVPVTTEPMARTGPEPTAAASATEARKGKEALQAIEPGPVRDVRRYERIQGAAAASVILLAVFLGRGLFQATPPGPERVGSVAAMTHLQKADTTLQNLIVSMQDGSPPEVVAENARALMTARDAARVSGADVTELDAAIKAAMRSLLPNISARTAAGIMGILGDLVGGAVPPFGPSASPNPEPSSAPSPTESPSPQPSPQPSPTESPSPQPSPPQPSPQSTPADAPNLDPLSWTG